jgi:hypothetical protein
VDRTLVAIMVFFLLAIILTGAFVLMIPLSRQLARFLEFRMREKNEIPGAAETDVRELRALVQKLDDKLASVSDRQEFLEKVLENRGSDPLKLPR